MLRVEKESRRGKNSLTTLNNAPRNPDDVTHVKNRQ